MSHYTVRSCGSFGDGQAGEKPFIQGEQDFPCTDAVLASWPLHVRS